MPAEVKDQRTRSTRRDPLPRSTSELRERNIREIIQHLRRRYPPETISNAVLEERVRTAYAGFATAHVRNYLAILVERMVRNTLVAEARMT